MMKTMKWVLMALVTSPLVARADLISNPVADGAIVVDASRSDWSGLTAYTADPADAGAGDVDFSTLFMAHDSTKLFIRYTTHGGPGFGSAWRYNIFVDIDQDRTTGYIGGGSQFSIGADVLIQGASLYSFVGPNQTNFSWNLVGAGSFNELPNDYEMSFARSGVPGLGTQFNWIALGDNFPNTDDYFPNGGSGGTLGTFHTYAIPEPATALLFAAGLGVVGLVCRVRSIRSETQIVSLSRMTDDQHDTSATN